MVWNSIRIIYFIQIIVCVILYLHFLFVYIFLFFYDPYYWLKILYNVHFRIASILYLHQDHSRHTCFLPLVETIHLENPAGVTVPTGRQLQSNTKQRTRALTMRMTESSCFTVEEYCQQAASLWVAPTAFLCRSRYPKAGWIFVQ